MSQLRPAAAPKVLGGFFDVSVDPGCRVLDAVSAFGPVRPDCEEFETAVSRLDGADGLRADADDVPLAKLVDLVVKPDPT
jgi:hypothetical protein